MPLLIRLFLALCLTVTSDSSLARQALTFAAWSEQIPDSAFEPLARYLSQALNSDVQPVPVADAEAIVQGMVAGRIDFAWLDAYSLLRLQRLDPASRALVRRPKDNQVRVLFIVTRKDIRSLADLRGTAFTFGSADSTNGWLMPAYLLRQQDINPATFFAQVAVAPSTELALRWLNAGQTDAMVMDSRQLTLQRARQKQRLRVIARSEPYADHSWSVRGGLQQARASALETALLALDPRQRAQRSVLRRLDAERYVSARPGPDEQVRQAERLIGRLK